MAFASHLHVSTVIVAAALAAAATAQQVIDYEPETAADSQWNTDDSWEGGFKPCPGDTAFLPVWTEDAVVQPYTVDITNNVSLGQITFSPGTFISFGLPGSDSNGDGFVGLNLIRQIDDNCFDARTTTTLTPPFVPPLGNTGGGDESSDNTLIIIIMAVIIGLLLCVVVAVFLFKRQAATATDKEHAVTSFENPMYETTMDKQEDTYDTVDENVEGTSGYNAVSPGGIGEMSGYNDVSSATSAAVTSGYNDIPMKDDGYLDVAAQDTYDVVDNLDGFEGGQETYETMEPLEQPNYEDVGPADHDVEGFGDE